MTQSFRRLAALCSVGLLAGCSVGVGQLSVDNDELEGVVTDRLEEMAGERPDAVDCPDDLEGEVGAEVRCTLTEGDDKVGLTVTTTSVKGKRVLFDIEVDDEVQ